MRVERRAGSLKVLIYAHSFAPNVGGIETAVMSLAKGVVGLTQTDGFASPDVTVVTSTPRGQFDDQSLPFRLVRQPGLPRLARLIRATDVLHLAGPCFMPMLLGLLVRRPVVVEHHGLQTICPNGQLLHEPTQTLCPGHFMAGRHRECIRCNARAGLVYSLASWLLTFPRRWLCTRVKSNITPTHWLSTVLRLPRMTTIHHGVAPEGNGKFPAATPSTPTVAYMGRLVTTKGVQILLQAAQRLNAKGVEFKLRIIGDGPQLARLEAQSRALGLADRVEFLGYLASSKVHEALAGVGIVVVPSLAGEVFGLVAAESMMLARLPIVSDGGALAEVVGDAGLKFPPGDGEALAACLQGVLQSSEFTAHQGRCARERARRAFSEGRMVEEHLAVYRRLLADGEARC